VSGPSGVIWAGACGMGRNERGEGGSERRELGPCGKRVGLGFGPVGLGGFWVWADLSLGFSSFFLLFYFYF